MTSFSEANETSQHKRDEPLEIQLKSFILQLALNQPCLLKSILKYNSQQASSNSWRVLKCYLLLILPTLNTPTWCNQSAEEWAHLPEGYTKFRSSANVTQISNSKEKGKKKKDENFLSWIPFLSRRTIKMLNSLIFWCFI